MTCQEASLLLPMRPGDLTVPEREALERHLQGCTACQAFRRSRAYVSGRLVEAAGALKETPGTLPQPLPPVVRSRPIWPWAAAAAVLLLGIKAFWTPSDRPSQDPTDKKTERAEAPPALLKGLCRAGKEDVDGVVGRAVSVALRRGGALVVEEAGLDLKSGALHVDSAGEAVAVRLPGIVVTLQDAAVSLEVSPSPAFSWLGSAQAADGDGVRLAVWRGEIEVTLAGRKISLKEGQGGVLSGEAWRLDEGVLASAWRGLEGWMPLEGAPALLRDEARELLPAGEDCVLEALVRKRLPVAELALRLPDGRGVYEFPLGVLLQASGESWTKLRVEYRGGWCRATLGSSGIVSCPVASLVGMGYGVEGKGLGLRVWGGDVELKQARWRKP